MKTIMKTIAVTALMSMTSTASFAAGHMNTSMSCEEYNGLSGANRDKIAMMAIEELRSGDVKLSDGTPTDTASAVDNEGDGSNVVATDGTATATESSVGTGTAESSDETQLALLNRTCSRNWDATVMEAAAGQSGTR